MNLLWLGIALLLSGGVLVLTGFAVQRVWHPFLCFLWSAGATAGTAPLALSDSEHRLLLLSAAVFFGLAAVVVPVLLLLHQRPPISGSRRGETN
jgi:hypothetical protein